jgi:hypothetical protein
VALGRIGAQSLALGDLTLVTKALDEPQTACFAAVTADGKPLGEAKTLFLFALQRAENPGMKFNATRTSIGDQWGEGPAHVLALEATVTLPGSGWKVEVLNAAGAVTRTLPMTDGAFTLSAADATMWYRAVR